MARRRSYGAKQRKGSYQGAASGGTYLNPSSLGGGASYGNPQAAPTAQAQPLDYGELMAQTTGRRNIALSDADATYQTGRINRDFGYDPSGNIDPSNPYSRAMLLEQNYKQSTMGNTNSYAASGQLYAGSLQNAQNETTRQHSISDNQLRTDYGDALYGVKRGQLGAYADAGQGISDEEFQALLRKLGIK